MGKIRDLWYVVRGQLSMQQLLRVSGDLGIERANHRRTKEELIRVIGNPELARIALSDFRERSKRFDAQQKAESDAIGDRVLSDIEAHPDKFTEKP